MQQSTSLTLHDALLILLDAAAAVANPATVVRSYLYPPRFAHPSSFLTGLQSNEHLELAYTTVHASISSVPKPPTRDWFKIREDIAQCLAIIRQYDHYSCDPTFLTRSGHVF